MSASTTKTVTVTVLGTGIMGAGMARNLIGAGFDVRVWNRTAAKARPLADDGATVVNDPAAAVAGAHVVLTVLFDVDAIADVMAKALPAMAADAIWVQSATVGLDGTMRLAQLAEEHGVGFVDAPVLGTRQPAEEGTLIPLVGGLAQLRDAVQPVFDAIGSRTIWVGERPGDGHRLKLTVNSWLFSVMGGTAQAVTLARGLGIDPQLFFETISGGPLDCAYAQLKGKLMMAGEFPPSFTLGGAVKDTGLIADAMRSAEVNAALMHVLHERFRVAADAGHGEEDMAAVVQGW